MPLVLLGLSVVLSTGRNLFSKKLSDIRFGTRAFFLCQIISFHGANATGTGIVTAKFNKTVVPY